MPGVKRMPQPHSILRQSEVAFNQAQSISASPEQTGCNVETGSQETPDRAGFLNASSDHEQSILLGTAGIVIAFFCTAYWTSRYPDRGFETPRPHSPRIDDVTVMPNLLTSGSKADSRVKTLLQSPKPDETGPVPISQLSPDGDRSP